MRHEILTFFIYTSASYCDVTSTSESTSDIYKSGCIVCVCIIPFRMARSRKGRFDDHHPHDVSLLSMLIHILTILLTVIDLLLNRLLATSSIEDGRHFLLLSITGHVSLFPLLFTQFENVAKVFLVLTYSMASYAFLSSLF